MLHKNPLYLITRLETTQLAAFYFDFQFVTGFSNFSQGTLLFLGYFESCWTRQLALRRRFLQNFFQSFHFLSSFLVIRQ